MDEFVCTMLERWAGVTQLFTSLSLWLFCSVTPVCCYRRDSASYLILCHHRIHYSKFESCLSCAPPPQQTAVPRNDEWTRFVRTLAEINENRDDAEELAAQRLAAWSPVAVDAAFKGPVVKLWSWTSFDILYFLSWENSAFSVSWTVTSLPWNNTKRQGYQPQTLTWSHVHKHTKKVVLSSTRCLNVSF